MSPRRRVEQWWNWLCEPVPEYGVARTVFLKLVAVTSFTAFLSLFVQIPGLIGVNGILPAEQFFAAAENQFTGFAGILALPSLAWVSASTAMLQAMALLGMVAAVLLFVDVAPRPMLLLQWVLYLSLVVAGQVFLSFQWDILLLETLFFSVFLAPPTIRRSEERGAPTRFSVLVLWFILFKLMLLSGMMKIMGGDPVWRDVTALSYHYVTQPLPNPVAWFMDKLPVILHQVAGMGMYVAEIGSPILLWMNQELRRYAAALIVFLQVAIIATGNYAFFNVLVIAYCALLFTDTDFTRMADRLPRYKHVVKNWFNQQRGQVETAVSTRRIRVDGGMLVILGVIQLVVFLGVFTPATIQPDAMKTVENGVRPFRTVNTYGLFVDMTTERPEIVVQGSRDGETWKTYEFKYKPGNVKRWPPVVAPHQPRLDWQMWFAALRNRPPTWFKAFTFRLLQRNKAVTDLLAENPFPETPPQYVRAVRYDYQFSTWRNLTGNGEWWQRKRIGMYMEPVSGGDVQ